MKAQTVELKIQGQKIALKTAGETGEVQQVVDLVTRRISQAEKRLKPGAAPHHVALIALLDIAEDYLSAKRKFANHQGVVQSKTHEILKLIAGEGRSTEAR